MSLDASPHAVDRLKHHALAILFVLLAFGLTLALQAVTSRAYYILFVPAVMCAAWYGGLTAGLTASVGTVVLTVAFLLPNGTLVDQLLWVVVAAVVAVATSTLVARRRAPNPSVTGLPRPPHAASDSVISTFAPASGRRPVASTP